MRHRTVMTGLTAGWYDTFVLSEPRYVWLGSS
jgi:hypothetical protein